MKEIGSVVALLDKKRVLVRCEQDLQEDNVIRVFSRISDDRLAEKAGLSFLEVTKGYLLVKTKQAEGIYLAEVYNLRRGEYQVVTGPSPLQRLLEGSLYVPKQETREVEEPSASVNVKQSLRLQVSESVEEGDLITLE